MVYTVSFQNTRILMSSEFLINIKTLMPKEELILFGSHALYLGLVGVRLGYRPDWKISWLTSMFVSSRLTQIRNSEINCSSTILNPCLFTFYLHRPVLLSRNIVRSGRSQWPCGLRLGSAVACMVGLWVRMPPAAWTSYFLIIMCCQVEVSSLGWSLVQRSPTVCCVWRWSWTLDNEEALAH